ncbi:hypothetical protein ACDF64_11080 [Agromyces sp. MMS24-JH15]|uniref:hypothetical protein n=1 Tax=Agromyces sp. MMS24-JH15 TaxID=3243765 RepID=UPI0037498F79
MSDNDWKAPDAPVPPAPPAGPAFPPPAAGNPPSTAPQPPYGQPGYGQPAYGPPGYGPAGYGPAGSGPGYPATYPPAGGWTPPPKPGLIPLRPLGFGTLLWAPFRVLRRNPAPTFGSGLLVQLATLVVTAAVMVPFVFVLVGRVENADPAEVDPILSGAVGGMLLAFLPAIALSIVASAFLQGILVVEVATGTVGLKLRMGELWRRAWKRMLPLVGWTLLLVGVVLVAFLVLAAIVALGALLGGAAGAVVGVLFAVLAGLGCLVLGAWIGVKLSLVPSVIVLEEAGIRQSIVRSWRLTNGYFWRTLGVELLVAAILSFASNLVSQPIGLLGGMAAALVDPTGTGASMGVLVGVVVLTAAVSLLVGAVTAVVQSAVVAVIYIDLRMRTEGLDIELERHVELRDAGQPVGDPFRTPQAHPGWA